MPRISVLVNTYNHERFIARALDSVAAQNFPASEMETIVVDDGSTDGTPAIVEKYSPGIRVIRKANGGQVSAFHVGVAEVHGDIVAFLDGDDWWADDKISRVAAAFEANPTISAIGHGYYEVDENDSIRGKWIPESGSRLSLATPSLALQSTSLRIFLGTSRLAVRKSVLSRALPVPPELPFFDNFIFSQAIAMGGALLLSEPLCYYRVHSGSLYASDRPNDRQLQTRYMLLCGLLERLPGRLQKVGVTDAAISAFLDFDRLEARRLKLVLEGGASWETYRVESMSFQLGYRNPTLGYRLFKNFTLLLTLLMPPKQFYRLRQWYADHGLNRWRDRFGKASDTVRPVVRESAADKMPPGLLL